MILNGNQFTMEMSRTETGNVPKSYSLNMFKDFVPMGVFSETPQGEEDLVCRWFFFLIIMIFFTCKKMCDLLLLSPFIGVDECLFLNPSYFTLTYDDDHLSFVIMNSSVLHWHEDYCWKLQLAEIWTRDFSFYLHIKLLKKNYVTSICSLHVMAGEDKFLYLVLVCQWWTCALS